MAQINLLPWREEQRQELKKEFLVTVGLVLALGIGLVLLGDRIVDSQIENQKARNQYLTENIKELDKQVTGLQGTPEGYTQENYAVLIKELSLAHEIVAADQFRWTALLSRFEELVPADVSIQSIQPDFKAHSLQLACVARDLSGMTQFLDKLLSSGDLNQVFLQRHGESEKEADGRKQLQVDFSLVIKEAF